MSDSNDNLHTMYQAAARQMRPEDVAQYLTWWRAELAEHEQRGLSERGGKWVPWERALRAKIAVFESIAQQQPAAGERLV